MKYCKECWKTEDQVWKWVMAQVEPWTDLCDVNIHKIIQEKTELEALKRSLEIMNFAYKDLYYTLREYVFLKQTNDATENYISLYKMVPLHTERVMNSLWIKFGVLDWEVIYKDNPSE